VKTHNAVVEVMNANGVAERSIHARCAAHATTAGAVMDRSPATNPTPNARNKASAKFIGHPSGFLEDEDGIATRSLTIRTTREMYQISGFVSKLSSGGVMFSFGFVFRANNRVRHYFAANSDLLKMCIVLRHIKKLKLSTKRRDKACRCS